MQRHRNRLQIQRLDLSTTSTEACLEVVQACAWAVDGDVLLIALVRAARVMIRPLEEHVAVDK